MLINAKAFLPERGSPREPLLLSHRLLHPLLPSPLPQTPPGKTKAAHFEMVFHLAQAWAKKNIDTKKQFTLGCAVPSIVGQNSLSKSMILKCSVWVWSIDGEFCLKINDVIWRSVNNFSVFLFPNICSQFCASFSAFGAPLCLWKVLVVMPGLSPGLTGHSVPLQDQGRFQKLHGAPCSLLSCQYNDNSSHFFNLLMRNNGSLQETGKMPLDKNVWH